MSNWHIRKVTRDGRRASVIFHLPVSVGNNSADPPKSWQDAVAEMIIPQDPSTGTFGIWFSQLQGIEAGELGQLQAGSLYEVVDSVSFLAQDTDVQKRDKIDIRFTELVAEKQTVLGAELKFWGFDGDVT